MKPIKEMKTDVLVLGGGPGGFGTALSAARNGAKVILVEKTGIVGGLAVAGLGWHTFYDLNNNKVVKGIAEELVDNIVELDGGLGPIFIENGHFSSTTPVDHEVAKYVILNKLVEAGVTLLLHSLAADVVCEDGMIKEVIVETKSDHRRITADVYIDATGDGDIAEWAGVPTAKGNENGGMQNLSAVYKMVNVDIDKVIADIGTGRTGRVTNEKTGDHSMWFELCFDKYRDELEKEKIFSQSHHVFWGNTTRKNEANFNVTRLVGYDGSDTDQLTQAEIAVRYQIFKSSEFFKKHVDGCQDAYVVTSFPLGVRETRRIQGEYTLTEQDVVGGAKFDDTIVRCGYPFDYHKADGTGIEFTKIDDYYDIPYRVMLPVNVDNLLVVGRCISCTSRALASARTMVSIIGMGEGAGVAAAMCVKEKIAPRNVDVKRVQEQLRLQGALI